MDSPKTFCQWNLKTYKDMFDFLDGQRARLKCGKDEVVLDVGCGPGDLTAKLVPTYFPPGTRLVGSDVSEKMVAYAQSHYSTELVSFRQMDIGEENIWERWQKESFDKILSIYVLHWVRNLRLAMSNIYSLLKKNGAVFILLPSEIPFIDIFNAMGRHEEFIEYTKGVQYFRVHPTDPIEIRRDYTEMLRDIGFKDIDVTNKTRTFHYSSYEAFYHAVRSLDPYLKYIPDNLRDRYNQAINLAAYKCVSPEPDSDFVRMDYRLTHVYARK